MIDRYSIEFNVNISFNSSKDLFKCRLGKEKVFVPRKGMIQKFNGVFIVNEIQDTIKECVRNKCYNESPSSLQLLVRDTYFDIDRDINE